jgi:hypothetical protein
MAETEIRTLAARRAANFETVILRFASVGAQGESAKV